MTEQEQPRAGDAITFIATLPPIQSAITLDGNGDGARIKLDVPRSHVGAVLLLQHYGAGRALRITVTIEPDPPEW